MRAWGVMLGGLLVWAVHFLGVYGVASIADLSPDQAGLWRVVAVVFSIACLAALWPLFVFARRGATSGEQSAGLVGQLGQIGAAIAAIAILFQSLPILLSA